MKIPSKTYINENSFQNECYNLKNQGHFNFVAQTFVTKSSFIKNCNNLFMHNEKITCDADAHFPL